MRPVVYVCLSDLKFFVTETDEAIGGRCALAPVIRQHDGSGWRTYRRLSYEVWHDIRTNWGPEQRAPIRARLIELFGEELVTRSERAAA